MNDEHLSRMSGPRPPADEPPDGVGDVTACHDSSIGRVVAAFAAFHQCLHAQQQSCWEDLDLTMSQFKALMLVSATGGLSGRELARRFGVGPSAITAIVERLVQRGYVRREEDVNDRRISWTRPTPAAIALFQQVSAGHDEQLDEILGSLSPDELATVDCALQLLRDAGARWLARQSEVGACPTLATGAVAGPCPADPVAAPVGGVATADAAGPARNPDPNTVAADCMPVPPREEGAASA